MNKHYLREDDYEDRYYPQPDRAQRWAWYALAILALLLVLMAL